MVSTAREKMGSVILGHANQSFVGQWARDLAAVVQRESSF
jgi:hypothetical protein